ncbi:MAG: SIR2 family protein [Chloroflexota bacterium]|nr:SIR2 family protein [Chloroflexota bacterium]
MPDLEELGRKVAEFPGDNRERAAGLLAEMNLEEALTWLRRVGDLLSEGQEFSGYTKQLAGDVERHVSEAIVQTLIETGSDIEPYRRLSGWLANTDYQQPVEIFTLNYDLLLEQGFEDLGVPYFDGFVGSLRGRFRRDMVDVIDLSSGLGPRFHRLWKLHGSLNWVVEDTGVGRRIVRTGQPAKPSEVAAIYPSEAKYEDSRRVPFVVLFDRFRRALETPESLLMISGYSFGDDHINEIVFEGALAHPRSETLAFCFSEIPAVVRERAIVTRNFTVFSPSELIIGGQEARWKSDAAIPGVYEDGSLLLGDFKRFAASLVRTESSDERG